MKDDDIIDFVTRRIPLTDHMGLRASRDEAGRLQIGADLEPNLNHKKTAFGGSLQIVAILSCWLWVMDFLKKMGLEGELVIQKNEAQFLKPVMSDFYGQCEEPSQDLVEKFLESLKRHHKGRIRLQSSVWSHEKKCLSFSGDFVVVAPKA